MFILPAAITAANTTQIRNEPQWSKAFIGGVENLLGSSYVRDDCPI